MLYGYSGTMKTRPGHRDDVVELLLAGVDVLADVGCEAYLVAVSPDDPDTIWVTEVWQSRQHHEDSLQLPDVKATIAKAMPMLTGEFAGHETAVVGGLGVRAGS
jgi:quinol monooxygenase YgiN